MSLTEMLFSKKNYWKEEGLDILINEITNKKYEKIKVN